MEPAACWMQPKFKLQHVQWAVRVFARKELCLCVKGQNAQALHWRCRQ